jgi:hypothetical protein
MPNKPLHQEAHAEKRAPKPAAKIPAHNFFSAFSAPSSAAGGE